MSGNVHGLGYQLDKVTHCNTQRGGCGARIYWGQYYGKRHPFNLDGTSHFDSCPNADHFRKGRGPSLSTLGDRDTFYRERWFGLYMRNVEVDVAGLSRVELPAPVAQRVADALVAVGGPYQWWSVSELVEAEFFVAAGADQRGNVVCVYVRSYFLRDLALRCPFLDVPVAIGGLVLIGDD